MTNEVQRRADAINKQGLAAARKGDKKKAAALFQEAIQLVPGSAKYHINLGAMLNKLGRHDEAEAIYRRLLAALPDFAPARYNLAVALRHSGRPDAARREVLAALAENPSDADAATYWRNLCCWSLYDPRIDPAERFALHRQWNARFPAAPPRFWLNPPLGAPPRPLRIGVLSSDLRDHPVGKNYGPIFQALDPRAFILYGYNLNDSDAPPPAKIRRAFQGWKDVRALSDEKIAEVIRTDKIDILLLLCGHFDENRPLVAQYRPAPLVIGAGDDALNLDGFDYFITNATLTPRRDNVATIERPLRPPSFYVHEPPPAAPPLTPVPDQQRFIATHNPNKLTDAVYQLWGEILRRAPAASLTLRYQDRFCAPKLQARVRERMGADVAERVIFAGGFPSAGEHFADLSRHCVLLDSFPFTGATAVFEALWMGVPVAAMRGRTWHERMSSGLLAQIGLSDLSAATPAEYVALAVALIQDRARLELLRRDLRDRLIASSICQPQKTARWFGRLFHAIWRRRDAAWGDVCAQQGIRAARAQDFAAAAPWFERAVAAKPRDARQRVNWGTALRRLGRLEEAISQHRQALALDPSFAGAARALGDALLDAKRPCAAVEVFAQATRLEPQSSDLWNKLAHALHLSGRPGEAVAAQERVVALRPNDVGAWRGLLMYGLYDPALAHPSRREQHRRFNAQFPADPKPVWPHAPLGAPPRRLRIGVVSSDFRNHPVTRNYGPIFHYLDRNRFELIFYHLAKTSDRMTEIIKKEANLWREAADASDAELAQRMRADHIDVALLLAPHFDENRPLLAQRRPAPVVIAAGDAAMELDGVDYLLTTARINPAAAGRRDGRRERPLRAPNFYVHSPLVDAPPPGPLPVEKRFFAPHNPAKLNAVILGLWGEILRRAPDATLTLRYHQRYAETDLQEFIRLGCGQDVADRLLFFDESQRHIDHLDSFSSLRVMLDASPFNAATVTFECLWMGVPVVSWRGDDYFSRFGADMLGKVGLEDCVAATPEAYIDRAVTLIADDARLTALREELRPRVARSLLCDGRKTARWFERAITAAWRRYEKS